ncbi:MAG: M14 family metallopeptidase [Caldiserica bacterium]|nr:M14 family metallopeptidase [Caldisericota bacterium]
MRSLIPQSYEASRERFRSSLARIALRWPSSRMEVHLIREGERDLSIDVLHAPATGQAQHMLVVTTGEHGIEGFVGSAVMELAMSEVLPALDPEATSLCLVHAINPWGMKHEQRTNAANVDLNRNFVMSWDSGERVNDGYRSLRSTFQPQGPMPSVRWNRLLLTGKMMSLAAAGKSGMLRQALLAGQYEEQAGLYYGGTEWQPETQVMRHLVDDCLKAAPHLVHVDLHTGYGPRNRMSVVNSELDPVPSTQWMKRIDYQNVVATTPLEFYRMEGDMIDYIYRKHAISTPTTPMYATCFEFGCLGDSLLAQIDSLWCAVANNRLRQHGAVSEDIADEVRRLWREAYCPSEPSWEEHAHSNALRAFRGILHDQGLIS